ncbi:hypothetical protein Bca4012_058366 [Brassica carinata]|uniref:Uncharacterized protein n=1 Tax=Brassica carinata TaxID=52824 RepID=A0A8X7W334_BRACI|nr:hypothetical protein Bca52824_016102 [Brassica carinata]
MRAARRRKAIRATSQAARPNLQCKDGSTLHWKPRPPDNGAGMADQHTSLLQGSRTLRLKRRSYTLPRAHTENR